MNSVLRTLVAKQEVVMSKQRTYADLGIHASLQVDSQTNVRSNAKMFCNERSMSPTCCFILLFNDFSVLRNLTSCNTGNGHNSQSDLSEVERPLGCFARRLETKESILKRIHGHVKHPFWLVSEITVKRSFTTSKILEMVDRWRLFPVRSIVRRKWHSSAL